MVMQLNDVKIIDFEDVDLQGATVIAGFPSIGLVSTIAANYLIAVSYTHLTLPTN